MRQMYRLLVLALAVAAMPARSESASNGVSCTLWTTVVSRSLFNNTGTYGTQGPAWLSVPECVGTGGVYGSLFLSAPLNTFDAGKEIDLRFGRRADWGMAKVDASAAWYYFGVGSSGGARNMHNTGDIRLKVSGPVYLGGVTTVAPYGTLDYQRSADSGVSTVGLAGGGTLTRRLQQLGSPVLTIDGSTWYYPKTPNPNRGPITDLDISLGYTIGTVMVGPHMRLTWGDVSAAGNGSSKHSVGVFVLVPL